MSGSRSRKESLVEEENGERERERERERKREKIPITRLLFKQAKRTYRCLFIGL